MARIHAAIAERASQQLGLVTTRQLTHLGLTEGGRRTLLRSGVLDRSGPGIFRHAAFPPTWEQRLLAAVWAAGEGAAISHMAAAAVWGFDGIGAGAVEISVPLPRHPRAVRGRVHRVRDLARVDVTRRGLLVVTTPARTLVDTASRLAPPQIEEALDGACRRGQVDLQYLEWRVDELRRSGRAGIAKLDTLLAGARRQRGEESWLESAFLRLLRDAGLPFPRVQVEVGPGSGGRRYRLDATYDAHDLVIEVDGHATHATRRQRQADAERDARLQAEGRRVLRFTYEDVVERPGYVVSTVATFLGLALPSAVA